MSVHDTNAPPTNSPESASDDELLPVIREVDTYSDGESAWSTDGHMRHTLNRNSEETRQYNRPFREVIAAWRDAVTPFDRFSHFSLLPPEIKCLIWHEFCPELKLASRLFQLFINDIGDIDDWRGRQHPFPLEPMPSLSHTTRNMRAVLAIDQNSRNFATTFLPDTLPIKSEFCQNKRGIIRLNCKTDVVELPRGVFRQQNLERKYLPKAYLERVVNIAFRVGASASVSEEAVAGFEGRLGQFRKLKRVYYVLNSEFFTTRRMRWAASTECNAQLLTSGQDEWPIIHCWPGCNQVTPAKLTGRARRLRPVSRKQEWELLPLVAFSDRFGWDQYGWILDMAELSDEQCEKAAESDTWKRPADLEVLEPMDDYNNIILDSDDSADNVSVVDAHTVNEIAGFGVVTTG